VLEARDRVGGRAWRIDVGGLPFDAGCEALDDAHEALLGLAGELGVRTWHAEPWAGHEELPEELRALEEAIVGADLDDEVTLGGWLRARGVSKEVFELAERWYGVASSSVPIDTMSLYAYAAKQEAGAAPHGLRLRFEGGPSALAERLAQGIEVRLGVRVRALEQQRGGVRARLWDGTAVRAPRAIVAVPLTLQREISFDPPLPQHRRLALARARYGAVVKAAFAYDDLPATAVPVLASEGLLYRPDPRFPLLALFAGARAAAGATRFRLGQPRAVAAVDWTQEPFTRGSYLIFGPGDLSTWGRRLAEPQGLVHFAGSEASALPSYMEGAVRAGERAAREVVGAG
jgi:monoamine oxidase